MARHHDQTRPGPGDPDPAGPDADERLADRLAVPGEARPVVWRTPPAAQPGGLSAQLARRLLDEYTQPGDVVLDVDDDVVFAATAAAAGRRHHALGGARHLAAMSRTVGYLDLILLGWPRPAVNPQWLLRACRALLNASGSLVVAAHADADTRVGHLSALRGVAATAGLRTIAHVAVVAPDAATPVAAPDPRRGHRRGRPASHPGPDDAAGAMTSAHTDLLILGVEAACDE